MLIALLICSDEACEVEVESWGELEDFDVLVCECGCTLQVVQLSYAEEARLERRAAPKYLPLAA